MRLPIRAKLFLTLLLACVLVVVGTGAFVHWSLERGLMELADARELRRIEEIGERLIAIHTRDGSWATLAQDRQQWIAALIGHREDGPPGAQGGPPEDRGGPPGDWGGPRRGHLPPWLRRSLAEPGEWPPLPPIERREQTGRPVPLELRLMLLDAADAPIYARKSLLPGARRHPLERDGKPIGTLVVTQGPAFHDLPELELQASQWGRLWIIALGMVAISAALAYPLSRRLVRPVRELQEAARRLAAGDFATRVRVQGGDEIARLGRDINALATVLGQNEAARRRWVADISHELRTPIALLRAELEALQDGVRTLDRGAVDALHGDVLRLGRLVQDLHELSVTDLGALSYRMEETDLRAVLESDLDAYRPRFAAAHLTLTLNDRAPGPLLLQADGDRLSQLLRNLLANSLQYTDPGGGLAVVLGRDAGHATIDFQDSAPGVPPEALPRLFERLYRVDASRSRHTGGSGLGLAIARNVVEAHGGTVVAKPSPTGGLWVRIELPV
jgi:two-component system, OmpR family, sensor histidine kinase BaeS